MARAAGAVVEDRRTQPTEAVGCSPEALARYFRVLGDPTRLRIVEALLGQERTVSELVAITGAPQSRVSNHLACLKWCRVAESEPRGRQVVYRIADARLAEVVVLASRLAAEHCEHLASCGRIGPGWT
jgi:ArsR family transcriptional regulator, cadmium/lead-responsive transcriptional repressor